MKEISRVYFISIVLVAFISCDSQTDNQQEELPEVVTSSLDTAVEQYKAMNAAVPSGLFPRTVDSTAGDSLITNESNWWTSGFFPGSLWYLYEYSGGDEIKKMAIDRTWSVEKEKNNSGDHDIGFKIYCSFGNAYRITGDPVYTPVLMTAAQTLTERYDEDVQAIRSWGDKNDESGPFQVIVDNMMNLELLFWATGFSGDSTYARIAINHADKTLENHFRPDGSSFHVVDYDPQSGEVLRKRTAQGYADSSAWARGQSWGLYGYTDAFRETGFERYLQQAEKIADFLLNHSSLPDDTIPLWDYDAPEPESGDAILRDTSAGAIMASALLELSTLVDDSEKSDFYRSNAKTIIRSLSRKPYRAEPGTNSHFLLKHSVGNKPGNSEVNVPLSYADYYYIEALMRYRNLEDG